MICGGAHRGLRLRGGVSATRRSTRRPARRRRAGSRGLDRSPRTACTSTSPRRRCVATPGGRCSCGSTAAASRRTRSRNYDGTKLAAAGVVVVTINYRLGALGFLAHPALASRPGGPAGNYGLMDQQAALRWVQAQHRDASAATRATSPSPAQSAGGVAVLAHLVSSRSRGLFQRAIVESGAFALNQVSLADAEAFGTGFAASVGCPDQTATCLRHVPVQKLVDTFPGAAIPGVVDGKVLTESIGTALAAGHFARVPIINGVNHDEERLFVAGPPRGREWRHVRLGTAADPGDLREHDRRCARRAPTPGRRHRRRVPARFPSRRSLRSARWSPTRTSRARRCRSTAGRPSGCRPSPTSSTTTPRPSASRRPAR